MSLGLLSARSGVSRSFVFRSLVQIPYHYSSPFFLDSRPINLQTLGEFNYCGPKIIDLLQKIFNYIQ